MGRKPTPTKAKASKSATTSNTKASPPTLPDVIEPKPDRVPNPLLTDPAIHVELQPLRDALVMVVVQSGTVADCCGHLLAMKKACGMPKPGEWPDSPTLKRARARHAEQVKAIRDRPARKGRGVVVADYIEPRWTELMRNWCGCFRDWCAAIATAKELAASPAVAALMNAGESRPAQRWTARTTIELDNLARTLHPVRMGEDGMGFIREGLRPLAPGFHACIEVVRDRIAELRSIPVAAVALVRGDDVYRPAAWFSGDMPGRLRKAASKNRKTKRVRTRKIDGVVVYSVADARRWWPRDMPKEA
jgi:hypothetical protein